MVWLSWTDMPAILRRRDTPDEQVSPTVSCAVPLSLSDYLQKILTARVYDVAVETPLDIAARRCRARLGNTVLLKREDTQPVFSFKLRGAYNKMIAPRRRASSSAA